MIESTARRLQLLTFHPMLRASLGAAENLLDFARLMDEGISVIHDTGGLDPETQRFLCCLLAVGYEAAAMSRARLPEHKRRPHHLYLEEFPQYVATNEESLSNMLAQTRKFALYVTLLNQVNVQIGKKLQGAMGNIGVEIAFRLNADDAREAAPRFTHYDNRRLTYSSPTASPHYASRSEQIAQTVTRLENLPKRHALVRLEDRVCEIETLTVPATTNHVAIAPIKKRYAAQLRRPLAQRSYPTDRDMPSQHHSTGCTAHDFSYFEDEIEG
jgi:hypothetical protein